MHSLQLSKRVLDDLLRDRGHDAGHQQEGGLEGIVGFYERAAVVVQQGRGVGAIEARHEGVVGVRLGGLEDGEEDGGAERVF